MTTAVNEISIPDSKIAHEITELVRDRNRRFSFIIQAAFIIGARWRASDGAAVRSRTALRGSDVS